MKIKVLSLVTVLTLVFVGLVVWKIDNRIYADKLSSVEVQARTQGQFVETLLLDRLYQFQKVLNVELKRAGPLSPSWENLRPFVAVTKFQFANQQLNSVETAEKTKGFVSSVLASELLVAANKEMKLHSAGPFWILPLRLNNQAYSALMVFSGGYYYALLSAGSFLGPHQDVFKNLSGEVFVLTQQGMILSRLEAGYVGSALAENKLLSTAKSSRNSKGVVSFDVNKEPVTGFFQKIPQTNLMVLNQISAASVSSERQALWMQFLLMGIGFLCFALAALYVLFWRFEKSVMDLEGRVSALIRGEKIAASSGSVEKELSELDGLIGSLQAATARRGAPTSGHEMTKKVETASPDRLAEEKMGAYVKVASSLAHELRGPLSAVIGFAQMSLAEKPVGALEGHLNGILREVRQAKNILDKLFVFAGEKNSELVDQRIEAPVLRALKNIETLLSQKGVKVTKSFNSQGHIPMNVDSLTMAVENILRNSVEAMERMPGKEIQISLEDSGDATVLQIKDTGEGIPADKIDKVQDPFFTTRSFLNHVGLGLSMATGVVREHQGQMFIESQKGSGTTVKIIFNHIPGVTSASLPKAVLPAETLKSAADDTVTTAELFKAQEQQMAQVPAKENKTMSSEDLLEINIDDLFSHPAEKEVVTPKAPAQFVAPREDIGAATKVHITKPMPVVEEKVLEDDKTPVNFVNPPDFVVSSKDSELDQIKIEVRRPRVRLD